MNRHEAIKNTLARMDTETLVSLYNSYAAENDLSQIWHMEELDEALECLSSEEKKSYCDNKEFYPYDKYFICHGWDYASSFNCWNDEKSPICIDEIASYIDSEGYDLRNHEIRQVLVEYKKGVYQEKED